VSKLAENKVDIIGILNNKVTDIMDVLNSQKAEIENLNIALKAMRGTANTYKRECKRLENEVERLDYMLEEVSK
jgi:archaellum component FlaC